jgi:hypothetical protein
MCWREARSRTAWGWRTHFGEMSSFKFKLKHQTFRRGNPKLLRRKHQTLIQNSKEVADAVMMLLRAER